MNAFRGMYRAHADMLFRNHAVDRSSEFAWFVHDCYCAYVSGFARAISAKRKNAESLWRVLQKLKAAPLALSKDAYAAAHISTKEALAFGAGRTDWEELFPGADLISKAKLERDQRYLSGICEGLWRAAEECIGRHKESPTKEDLMNMHLEYSLFLIVSVARPYVAVILNKDFGGNRPDAEWRRMVESAAGKAPPSTGQPAQ